MATRSKCVKCGTRFDGKGSYCLHCVSSVATLTEKKAKRRTETSNHRPKVQDGPICPHCRTELTWDNLGYAETEVSIYVREKMYFCSGCRAVLGFSSWHTEG